MIRQILEKMDNDSVWTELEEIQKVLTGRGWEWTDGVYEIDKKKRHVFSDIWFYPAISTPGEYDEWPKTYIQVWEVMTPELEQTGEVARVQVVIDGRKKDIPATAAAVRDAADKIAPPGRFR